MYAIRSYYGQELAAHVAAAEDGAIDGGLFGGRKSELVFHGFPFWKREGACPWHPVISPGRSSDSDSLVAAPSRLETSGLMRNNFV